MAKNVWKIAAVAALVLASGAGLVYLSRKDSRPCLKGDCGEKISRRQPGPLPVINKVTVTPGGRGEVKVTALIDNRNLQTRASVQYGTAKQREFAATRPVPLTSRGEARFELRGLQSGRSYKLTVKAQGPTAEVYSPISSFIAP